MALTAPSRVAPEEVSRLLERFSRPGVPKYTALRDAVVHGVSTGRFSPGDRLPNEQDLASMLPISLGTIQRALRQLVDEGVLQRRHGQGSFITGRTLDAEMSHPLHCRFVDDGGKGYLKVFPEATGRRTLSAPGEWAEVLGATDGVEITRRIAIGSEFAVSSSFVVDANRMPIFSSMPLKELSGENFKDVIFRATGQMIQRVDLFLRQRGAPADVAELIDVEAGGPCLSLRAIAYLGEGDPIYYQQLFIPPNERELHVISDARSTGLR
jgi:GntR family transcriptional regulator